MRHLRTLAVVTLAVVTLAVVLAVAAVAVAQDSPRYGGVLNWYIYGDPGRLDIHAESPLSVQQAVAGVYSGLLHHDPDDPTKTAPDLAERYTMSPDGKVYTFHLRKGVKFHFVDKKVRGYKFAPTIYDNNTMMKVWLAP